MALWRFLLSFLAFNQAQPRIVRIVQFSLPVNPSGTRRPRQDAHILQAAEGYPAASYTTWVV